MSGPVGASLPGAAPLNPTEFPLGDAIAIVRAMLWREPENNAIGVRSGAALEAHAIERVLRAALEAGPSEKCSRHGIPLVLGCPLCEVERARIAAKLGGEIGPPPREPAILPDTFIERAVQVANANPETGHDVFVMLTVFEAVFIRQKYAERSTYKALSAEHRAANEASFKQSGLDWCAYQMAYNWPRNEFGSLLTEGEVSALRAASSSLVVGVRGESLPHPELSGRGWRCYDCATIYTGAPECPECKSTGRCRVGIAPHTSGNDLWGPSRREEP